MASTTAASSPGAGSPSTSTSAPAPSFVFVGAACLDIVLGVPRFPEEDAEVRIESVRKCVGGNATNAATVAAQLGQAFGGGRAGLIAAVTDPKSDTDSAFVYTALAGSGVAIEGLVPVAQSGLPTSYIALAPTSRTILHSRTIRELNRADVAAGLEALSSSSSSSSSSSQNGTPAWVHFEGRSVEDTIAVMEALRTSPRRGAGSSLRPVVSVEIEKPRSGSVSVEALIPLADVVFLGKEYATTVLKVQDAMQALEYARSRARESAFVVVPWGEDGVWANGPGAGAGAPIHCPAHAPSTGRVVDTIGAGDCFVGAFVAYTGLQGGGGALARKFLHEVVVGSADGDVGGDGNGAREDVSGPHAGALLQAWLDFAATAAGEKCGQSGLHLSEGALGEVGKKR
jgi:sugar/nucleoside kinase (ribokinase family)